MSSNLGTSTAVIPGTLTGDISQLHAIQTFNGGYVSFAGGNGGKITQKGIVINGVLSFENVIYAPELKCSLLSVSQISLWTTDNDIRLSSEDLDAFFDTVHDVVQPRQKELVVFSK